MARHRRTLAAAAILLLAPGAALAQAPTPADQTSRIEQRSQQARRNERVYATPEQERATTQRAADRIRTRDDERVERGFVPSATAAEHRRDTNARRTARAEREAGSHDQAGTLTGLARAPADRAERRARGSETRRALAAQSDGATDDARAALLERVDSHRD